MRREEYLQQRRLQGLNSRIRRAEYQVQRGHVQIDGMKQTLERNKSRHDDAIKKIELRVKRTEDQIESMKRQRSDLGN